MIEQRLSDPSKMCHEHMMKEHADTHRFIEMMEDGEDLSKHIEQGKFFGAEYVKYRHELLSEHVAGHGSVMHVNTDLEERYPLQVPTADDVVASITELFNQCKPCAIAHLK